MTHTTYVSDFETVFYEGKLQKLVDVMAFQGPDKQVDEAFAMGLMGWRLVGKQWTVGGSGGGNKNITGYGTEDSDPPGLYKHYSPSKDHSQALTTLYRLTAPSADYLKPMWLDFEVSRFFIRFYTWERQRLLVEVAYDLDREDGTLFSKRFARAMLCAVAQLRREQTKRILSREDNDGEERENEESSSSEAEEEIDSTKAPQLFFPLLSDDVSTADRQNRFKLNIERKTRAVRRYTEDCEKRQCIANEEPPAEAAQ